MKNIIIYTDGSCLKKNPEIGYGNGGYCAILMCSLKKDDFTLEEIMKSIYFSQLLNKDFIFNNDFYVRKVVRKHEKYYK